MLPGQATFSSSQVVNIEDLRHLARRRFPRAVFDYLDGGADCEITLRENCSALDEIYLRPFSGVAFESVDLGVRILGHNLSLPFLLAPVGYSRLMHPDGELAAARGRRLGHSLHPVHHFRSQTRRRQSSHERPRLVPALPARWARRCGSRD